MTQASTPMTMLNFFCYVMKLTVAQMYVLQAEGITNVKHMIEFEDNDVNNVVLNLRQPQDTFHAEIPTITGMLAVAAVAITANATATAIPAVAAVAAVAPTTYIDAQTVKQAPLVLVLGALSVEKLMMAGQLVCHYEGIRRTLTKENKTYVILQNFSDHFKLVKVAKKDQDIGMMKV